MDWDIQPYAAGSDAADAYALWQSALGQTWPIDANRFFQVLAGPQPQHFVVRDEQRVVGLAVTFQTRQGNNLMGHLAAIVVMPSYQHRGIGSALHDMALEYLRTAHVGFVQLGAFSPRFWCGMPTNLPDAMRFFARHGWEYAAESVYDMTRDLSDYETPAKITQRMAQERITIEPAHQRDITQVLTFEQQHFPNWLIHFEQYADMGDFQDLLVARDDVGNIVGTLVMSSPQSHPQRPDVIWQSLLGQDAGSLGSVGVAESERGRGIGIALVARASEILKSRSVRNCYIDWLVLIDFYGKLGYSVWREYRGSWRSFPTTSER
ncbi:MAG TPA: GNAT family N-acetyltransferase [Ktedonobacteraceae bacterium]|jgi:beta-N-acetylhexosaminidase|nr:GNAT family N-acetyltransferase [Ktedonobacteraceae bacterium]